MSIETCIVAAKKWADDNSEVKLNSAQLTQLGTMLDHAERLGATPAQKNEMMSLFTENKLIQEQTANRTSKYLSAITAERGIKTTTTNLNAWIENGMDSLKAPVEAFLSRIRGGSNRPGLASNMDPLAMEAAARAQYVQVLRRALGPEDERILMGAKIGDDISRDIYQALDHVERKVALPEGFNDQALRIAKAIRASQDYTLNDVKAVNPFVNEAANFLIHRNHDRDLIMANDTAEGKAAWIAQARKSFAPSFLGMDDTQKAAAFGDIYEQIKAGTYGNTDFSPDHFWEIPGTSGNQAKGVAGSRSLVATDWQSEYEYAAKYGKDIYKNTIGELHAKAQEVAALQKWGPTPAETFRREFAAVAKTLNPEQRAAFERALPTFKEAMNTTMGYQDNEAHGFMARQAQNLMGITNAAGMGMHVPRALNGYQAAITLTRDAFGNTYPENAASLATHVSKAILEGDFGRDGCEALGVGLRSSARDQMGFIARGADKPGMIARAGELVGKLSLNDQRVSSLKFGMADIFTSELGFRSDKSFSELPPELQETLGRYSHSPEAAWEAIRKTVYTDGAMKGKITPEGVRSLSEDDVQQYLKDSGQKAARSERDFNRARLDLSMTLGGWLNDVGSLAASESNSRSRIAAFGSSTMSSGVLTTDAWGIARRFMMQFKQASLIQAQLAQRTFMSGGQGGGNYNGLMQHLLVSGFLSATGEYLIQAATGKSLQDPRSPEMLARIAMGTGGAGVYGDALINALKAPTASAEQAALSGSVLGPSVGLGIRAFTAGTKTARGIYQNVVEDKDREGQYGGNEWAKLINQVTPGQNIFYTKAALDYVLMTELHEFMGGRGYLEGLNRSLKKSGQEYTFGGQNVWR